jgi:hypothetical protein
MTHFEQQQRKVAEREARISIEEMRQLLYGDPVKGTGGIAHLVHTIGETLYGSEKVEVGLVKDVANIKRLITMGAGAIIGAQVVIQVVVFLLK